ncbi:SUN domain-containing protein 2-like isoform X1 [Biomphalaria glabrata]|uniref:SUN domain-containing protein 2-like isoform X1 n=1 Tax=Biomphalaria glabrata TaxID=6526 RepID=A0A9W2ZKQ5_BIOGL|nr:SUN domain-containing protein 2-like isoform X1 [Biomphalaria glabrata]
MNFSCCTLYILGVLLLLGRSYILGVLLLLGRSYILGVLLLLGRSYILGVLLLLGRSYILGVLLLLGRSYILGVLLLLGRSYILGVLLLLGRSYILGVLLLLGRSYILGVLLLLGRSYILGVLLLLGFLYLYGLTLLYQLYRLLRILAQTFLPSSWLKTTQEIVEEALYKYSADRLGITDYALESSGATVLCSSETYYSKFGMISVFNLPTWYHASTPSSVIQPDVQPGNCWAMNGNFGFVTIQLVMPVVVTAVTLEHIPKEISVAGRLDSAPRDFMIIGKERGLDSPDVILGSFTYKIGENPIQLFHIKDPNCLMKETPEKCGPNKLIISIITLKILNNYGNQEYTCIYRFRVHGNPQPSA